MHRTLGPWAGSLILAASAAQAANVYILSGGAGGPDAAVVAALAAHGHTATVGVEYGQFDGTVNLAGFDTVYLQCNANWSSWQMPLAGQQQLVDFVVGGGRLVTSEWVVYYAYPTGSFELLEPIIPVVQSFSYGGVFSVVYTQETPDPEINAGLPSAFGFPLSSYAGTETYTTTKPNATTYYTTGTSPGATGLAGWAVGAGRVLSFTSTCGPDQVNDPNFGRLLANVMGGASSCYADCEEDQDLDIFDFLCFQGAYANQDPYADCEEDGDWDIFDFLCFQGHFANGCN